MIEVEGCNVPSGVPDQPFSDAETKLGAMNRARGAKETDSARSFDFYAGIISSAMPSAPFVRKPLIEPVRLRFPTRSIRKNVGLEGGLEVDAEGKMQCFAWMVVFGGGDGPQKVGAARTATFEIPEKVRESRRSFRSVGWSRQSSFVSADAFQVAALVREGMELGHADDAVFKEYVPCPSHVNMRANSGLLPTHQIVLSHTLSFANLHDSSPARTRSRKGARSGSSPTAS